MMIRDPPSSSSKKEPRTPTSGTLTPLKGSAASNNAARENENQTTPQSTIDLNVRKRLAYNDLAVKMAAKSPVPTSFRRDREREKERERDMRSNSSSNKNLLTQTHTSTGEPSHALTPTLTAGKGNVNIFGTEDDADEYARLQIGYVDSSEFDEAEEDWETHSFGANRSVRSLARSSPFIPRIDENDSDDNNNEEERVNNAMLSQSISTKFELALAQAITASPQSLFDENNAQNNANNDAENDAETQALSVMDPKPYASPLDAHKKFVQMSRVKNRLQAMQALSQQRVLPTEQVLSEHKKARLALKSVSSSPQLSRKPMQSRDINGGAASPSLSRTPSQQSVLSSLSHTPSFRFVAALSKPLQRLGLLSHSNDNTNNDGNAVANDHANPNLNSTDTVSIAALINKDADAGGLTFQTPIDSVHKPIFSRKLKTNTFERFNGAQGKTSLSNNPATALRALQRLENDHDELNENTSQSGNNATKSAYNVPSLSNLKDTKNTPILKGLDSAMNALTFVRAEKQERPSQPQRKALSLEGVFGTEGLLMHAHIPAEERVDEEEYARLLRDPHSLERESDPELWRAKEREREEARARILQAANEALVELRASPQRRERRHERAREREREGEKEKEKVKRVRVLSERDLFADIDSVARKEMEKEKEKVKARDTHLLADKDTHAHSEPKLSKYVRALSKGAQSFVTSLLVHKENREKGTHTPTHAEKEREKPKKAPQRAEKTSTRAVLPYDEGESEVSMMPRPHPLSAPVPVPGSVSDSLSDTPSLSGSAPERRASDIERDKDQDDERDTAGKEESNVVAAPPAPHKSILKSATSSPSLSVKKKVVLVAENERENDTTSPVIMGALASITEAHTPVRTPIHAGVITKTNVPTTPSHMQTSTSSPFVFSPAAEVVAPDGLQFAYQHSTNSYVPANYMNESELLTHEHHRGKTRAEVEKERESLGLSFLSEREKKELREAQPVIFLPPDRFHIPLVTDDATSNNNNSSINSNNNSKLSAFALGSSVLLGERDRERDGESASSSSVLVYSPQHSSSLASLSNPLLLKKHISTPQTQAHASTGEGARTSPQSVFDADDDEEEEVDSEFYAHLVRNAPSFAESSLAESSMLMENNHNHNMAEGGEGDEDIDLRTQQSGASPLRAVPRNEKIFPAGVVVTRPSFPEVIREVVFPAHVAQAPHLVHYHAGLYKNVDVPPVSSSSSLLSSSGVHSLSPSVTNTHNQTNSNVNTYIEGEKTSPLTALEKQHERLSAQLRARQRSHTQIVHTTEDTINAVNPVGEVSNSLEDSLSALAFSPPSPSPAVADTEAEEEKKQKEMRKERPRVIVPALTATSLESLNRTHGSSSGMKKAPSVSGMSTTSEELKKKFVRSNPEALHVASSMDLRDEILQFMKRSESSLAQQYEQYVERTFKRPKEKESHAHNDDAISVYSDDMPAMPTSFYLQNHGSISSITNATFSTSAAGQHPALSIGGKLSLDNNHNCSGNNDSNNSGYNNTVANAHTREDVYKRLKANLDRRYEDDREGRFHMKQRIKNYLHEGVKEEYKLMQTYMDEMEDWK